MCRPIEDISGWAGVPTGPRLAYNELWLILWLVLPRDESTVFHARFAVVTYVCPFFGPGRFGGGRSRVVPVQCPRTLRTFGPNGVKRFVEGFF